MSVRSLILFSVAGNLLAAGVFAVGYFAGRRQAELAADAREKAAVKRAELAVADRPTASPAEDADDLHKIMRRKCFVPPGFKMIIMPEFGGPVLLRMEDDSVKWLDVGDDVVVVSDPKADDTHYHPERPVIVKAGEVTGKVLRRDLLPPAE